MPARVQKGPSLTHWGQVTHICVNRPTIIRSDNGLSPGRHHAIIWTNNEILLIGPLGTNFSEILIKFYTFRNMHVKMLPRKWWPFCLSLEVLIHGKVFLLCLLLFRLSSHILISEKHPLCIFHILNKCCITLKSSFANLTSHFNTLRPRQNGIDFPYPQQTLHQLEKLISILNFPL